jgi:YD repeat-containing protein
MTKRITQWLALAGWIVGLAASLVAPAHADSYIYDQFGRLTCINFTAGGSITYVYDAAGNRSSQVKSTSACS